jgi:nucleoside-diphosphate-sugar epimerase
MNRADELILLTGGTGAVGIPLLESYAREGVSVVAVGRSTSPRGLPAGVHFIAADVARQDLGLDPAIRAELQSRVTSIVHGAALTRFDAELEDARAVNAAGTRQMLAFASKCPKLRSMSVLSTVYVAGRRTGTIREPELDHDHGFVNAYERSKYEAEALAREAMGQLPVSVLRFSTVVGAHDDGRVHRAAAIHYAMRFLYHSLLPMMPGADDSPVDLIATEYAVAAVRHLSEAGFVPGSTRHICASGEAIGQAELIDVVVDAFVRYRPAWRRRAIEKPAIVDLRTFELFRESVDAVADPGLRASVAVLAPFAPQLSYPKIFDDQECQSALGTAGIRRPDLGETIANVVRYLIENNWAEPDARAVAGAEAQA